MEPSSQSRHVCCCGAKAWAQVIGWVQLIFGIMTFVSSCIALVKVINAKLETEARGNPTSDTELFYKLMITGVALFMVACAVSVMAGVILIIGVQKKNTGYLMTWTVLEVLKVLFCIGWGVTFISYVISTAFVGAVMEIFIAIFCIWVVNVHRQEILQGVGSNGVVYNAL